MMGGANRAQIIQTLAELKIADVLAGGHKTAAELGSELGKLFKSCLGPGDGPLTQ